ncbi:MAG: DUF3786 domain-containing protein [Candidatus Helarchaeota archaeon]
MPNNKIRPSDLVTMKQFEGGWIWIKNINEFSQNLVASMEKFEGKYDINKIIDYLNGEIITDWKLYDDTEYIFQFEPFPNTIILIIYNKNEEFGSEIKVFFNKNFLEEIPTEDAYCFVELYLKLIKLFIDSPDILNMKVKGEIISIDDLLDLVDKINKDKLKHEILEIRANSIEIIPQEIAEKVGKEFNIEFITGTWNDIQINWGLMFKPLKDVKIINIVGENGYQVYYSPSTIKISAREILFFTWLYCNAIIRKARKYLGDKLPKLSKYL